MALDRINWQALLVVVPLGHLAIVALYLWSWFVGFGAHVSVLADARDTFGLSISEIIPIYITGLLFPVILVGVRYSWKYPTAQARIDAISDPVVRQRQQASDNTIRGIIVFGIVALFAQSGVLCFDLYMSGQPTSIMLMLFVYFGGFALLLVLREKGPPISTFQWETTLLIGGLILAAISNGMSAGQLARHKSFDAARSHYLHCGSALVVRRLGDNFIGIRKGDQKVVTNLECKVIMVIPPHKGEATRHFHWQPFPHVTYDPA